jgi:hypothetical protein
MSSFDKISGSSPIPEPKNSRNLNGTSYNKKPERYWIPLPEEFYIDTSAPPAIYSSAKMFAGRLYISRADEKADIHRQFSLEKHFYKPIYIPVKFTKLIKNQGKVIIKIFVLHRNNFKKWRQKIYRGKYTYKDILSYIDEIRAKNLHEILVDEKKIRREKRFSHEEALKFYDYNSIVTSFKYSTVEDYYKKKEHENKLRNACLNLIECNRLLRTKDKFPDPLIEKINSIIEQILVENWRARDTQKRFPRRIRKNLKEAQFDAVDDFIFTLYQDLIKDMLKTGNFDICDYEYCSQIFKIDSSNRQYCQHKCSVNRDAHRRRDKKGLKIQKKEIINLFGNC